MYMKPYFSSDVEVVSGKKHVNSCDLKFSACGQHYWK